jgi:transcriptional regulator with XRE-family HTH domain
MLPDSTSSVTETHSVCNLNCYHTLTVSITFGKWLADNRERSRKTQGEVAKQAGVSVSYVSGLEREEPVTRDGRPRQPRRDKVEALAKAVGGDVNEALRIAGFATHDTATDSSYNILDFVNISFLPGQEISDDEKEQFLRDIRHKVLGMKAEREREEND